MQCEGEYVLLFNTYQSTWKENWSDNASTAATVADFWSWLPPTDLKNIVALNKKLMFFCTSSACYSSDQQGHQTEVGQAPARNGVFTVVGDKIVSLGWLSYNVEIFENGAWRLASWNLEQAIQDFCAVAISSEEIIIIGGVNSEIGR